MTEVNMWLVYVGMGLVWQGGLIIWVGGLPLAFGQSATARPEKGSPAAFGYFWLEQYRFIGLVLLAAGLLLALTGWLR